MSDITVPGLLTIHAHPDDEVITTGGLLAQSAERGLRVKVLTCTDGSLGDIAPTMNEAEIRPKLAQVRAEEIKNALAILGVHDQQFLGYKDSGMMGDPGNNDPASFWQANINEAVGKMVKVIRDFKPTVLVTYDAFGGYGHPDHIQAHRVATLAYQAAGFDGLYPEAGPGYVVPKVYHAAITKQRIATTNALLLSRNLPSPFGTQTDPEQIQLGIAQDQVTAELDVTDYVSRKMQALQAHASQVSESSFFVNFPEDLQSLFYGRETYERVRNYVNICGQEHDLFASLGIA